MLGYHKDLVELSVKDTGIGIPPEFLPEVFGRFSQADSSSTRTTGGLGLGLAISRHILELHGGGVRAESQGEGKGATFVVTLPLISTEVQDAEAKNGHGGASASAHLGTQTLAHEGPECAATPNFSLPEPASAAASDDASQGA